MNIFKAAVFSNNYCKGQNRYEKLNDREREIVTMDALGCILESYHYVGKQQYVDAMRANGAKVFLDSGAFSAYTLGVTLKPEDYCKYITDNLDIIRFEDGDMMASVLDAIGDARQTGINQQHMEYLLKPWGVRPMPTFHFEEPPEYLDWYVANYNYISLGGMVGAHTEQLRTWLERVWENHLLDGAGRAKIKVHGFGITSVPLMEEFDWYSCDSSSWIQSAAFGSIVLPGVSKSNPAQPISVSTKSPSRHDYGQHITTMSAPERAYLEKILNDNGFDVERLGTVYESRAAFNLYAFSELQNIMNKNRRVDFRRGKRQDLFGTID